MPEEHTPQEPMRSPLRPQRPDAFEIPQAQPADEPTPGDRAYHSEPESPSQQLARIREKMEIVAHEYGRREISRAQFNAIYTHYKEQRALIEAIIAKDPQSDGWKQASRGGNTTFLREHFEARPVNYVIFLHDKPQPIMGGGIRPDMMRIAGLLKSLWSMETRRQGIARLQLKEPYWLIMAAGEFSVTFVTFHMEPSGAQATLVSDLHKDFERANRIFLRRGRINKAMMVYPQRSLIENQT